MAADTSEGPSASSPNPILTNVTTTNPRGIPSFPFMTSISDYVTSLADVEPTLRRFQEMIAKYQFMETNVAKRAQGLREKLPEMKRTGEVVRFLKGSREKVLEKRKTDEKGPEDDGDVEGEENETDQLETTFSLSDTLYAEAKIRPSEIEEVYLWLGANVMVAYPLEEAEQLLGEKLGKAQESLRACEEDLEFLRVQITTLEVATARVYNWDVMEKRRLRAEGKLPEESEPKDEDAEAG